MKLAVLGSSGGMGRYFVRRLLEDGHSVSGHDKTKDEDPPRRLALKASNSEAARGADAVLLCVPIEETTKVGREVAPRMNRGSTLVEIASVKDGVRAGLKEAIRGKRVGLLSVHPMFGPHSTAANPRMLVLGGSAEVARSGAIFPWAELIPLGERDHDALMAYTLSLVHAVNVAFVSAVSKGTGVKEFQKASSPFGSAQLTLAKAVLSQDPALYSIIQTENPHSSRAISALIDELRSLQKAIEGRKTNEFRKRFGVLAAEFQPTDLEDALDRVYSSFG